MFEGAFNFRVPDVFNFSREEHFHTFNTKNYFSTEKYNQTSFLFHQPYYTNFFLKTFIGKKDPIFHSSYEQSGSMFWLHNPLAAPTLADKQLISYAHSSSKFVGGFLFNSLFHLKTTYSLSCCLRNCWNHGDWWIYQQLQRRATSVLLCKWKDVKVFQNLHEKQLHSRMHE